MKRHCRLVVAFLALPVLALAQESKKEPAQELKELQTAYNAAMGEYYKPLREAKTKEERDKVTLDETKNPARSFEPRFRDFAERNKGTETGLNAMLTVMRMQGGSKSSDEKPAVKVLDQIVAEYKDAPYLDRFVGSLRYGSETFGREKTLATLRAIAAGSPHKEVKANATFVLGTVLFEDEKANAADKAEGRKLLETVAKDFADTKAAKNATATLFEVDHLQIGMTCPDFAAKDLESQDFKLSDYRGKVVVVDFWGFW